MVESIKTAIRLGYRHLDAAESKFSLFIAADWSDGLYWLLYCIVYKTESELGVAIQESGVDRKNFFITGKVIEGISDIPSAFETTLRKLRTDYLDLYLIHEPFFAKSDSEIQNAWKELETLKASGRVRSIGVSNFSQDHISAILATSTIVPAINQIEFHPYLQQRDLLQYHRDRNIATAAYSPLTALTRAAPGPVDGIMKTLAAKYGKTEAAVGLRWVMEQGIVTVTTSSKESRMKEYLESLEFSLTSDEVSDLGNLGSKKQFRGFWEENFDSDNRSWTLI